MPVSVCGCACEYVCAHVRVFVHARVCVSEGKLINSVEKSTECITQDRLSSDGCLCISTTFTLYFCFHIDVFFLGGAVLRVPFIVEAN